MDTKLLVVGGGFIGMHIVDSAIARGWLVTIIKFTNSETLVSNPKVNVIRIDISILAELKEKLLDVKYDYIVNCGGYIDHTLFFLGGRKVIESHFVGVMNLVSVLDRSTLKSFVNLGSSDEYGNIPAPQMEDNFEIPISPYSFGKLASSRFLQMLFLTERFPATTLRPFLIYGPRQDQKRFLPQVIKGCLNNNTFPVSEGMQIRDFLFVKDFVEAIFMVFESSKARGEIINIASGLPVTIRGVISTIQRKINSGNPLFGEIKYRIGENMNLHASIDKARQILNWMPLTSLEMGLEATIDYYRNEV